MSFAVPPVVVVVGGKTPNTSHIVSLLHRLSLSYTISESDTVAEALAQIAPGVSALLLLSLVPGTPQTAVCLRELSTISTDCAVGVVCNGLALSCLGSSEGGPTLVVLSPEDISSELITRMIQTAPGPKKVDCSVFLALLTGFWMEQAVGLAKTTEELRFALGSEKVLLEELDRKNKELTELSITDGLTGLYNHRHIQERFDFEFRRVRRYGHFLSCLLLDVDHFKVINDTYGHQIGDFVLREIARIIKVNSRDVDVCGRYGGEEFMILCTQDALNAFKYAEKLQLAIKNNMFTYSEHSFHVTVSIGIAQFGADVKTKQEMIRRADSAMYEAKQDGRDLIRIWKEQEPIDERVLDQDDIRIMTRQFAELSESLRKTYIESTDTLVRAVDAKDHYTWEHSRLTALYSVALAEALSVSAADVEIIRHAALLHDIGKIGVSAQLLNKKTDLSKKEIGILRQHPLIGVAILRDIKLLEREIPMVLYHHEWWNGEGYPHRLKGPEIPLGARIVSIANAYVALIGKPRSGQSLSQREALLELSKGSGSRFAPELVTQFIVMIQNQSGETR